jgi:hypothetical protein
LGALGAIFERLLPFHLARRSVQSMAFWRHRWRVGWALDWLVTLLCTPKACAAGLDFIVIVGIEKWGRSSRFGSVSIGRHRKSCNRIIEASESIASVLGSIRVDLVEIDAVTAFSLRLFRLSFSLKLFA